ncbi:hypothetical protein G6F59_018507 [Rhizopus arrhizus]|nr:hypothetical protein G6F59_018507 [Rhizopus arrhizus]
MVERERIGLEARQAVGDLLAVALGDPDIDVRCRRCRRCKLLLAGLGLGRALGLRHGVPPCGIVGLHSKSVSMTGRFQSFERTD